jgi:methylenetetrahydrofolate reductase (NADPH)
MPAAARTPSADTPAAAVARIVSFMKGFSLEATKLASDDIAALRGILAENTPIYLTCVPGRPLSGIIDQARRISAAGFEPVPHLAARSIASTGILDELLANLAVLKVRRVLIVAGDRDRPAGPYSTAIEVIESGLLQRHGIREVGIAGYPEGHRQISQLTLERALAAKIQCATQTGLAVHIVTQFCFDAAPVTDWILRLRNHGIESPVRVGMAGPTNLATLIRYAQRCGVRASLQGMTRHAGLLKHLVGVSAPDGIIRPLAETATTGRLGQVVPHFYSFGGVAATGRWAAAAGAGRIVLDRAHGFQVEP